MILKKAIVIFEISTVEFVKVKKVHVIKLKKIKFETKILFIRVDLG